MSLKMLSPKYEDFFCIGCEHKCNFNFRTSIKMHNCIEDQYCIWPNKNIFFNIGVECMLISTHHNLVRAGFIFIDFSYYNIRMFTHSRWINEVKKIGLRIIIVSDRFMRPLAAYWQKNNEDILCIINASDTLGEINRKITLAFNGRRVFESYRGKLTSLEMCVLDMLLREYSVNQMADLLSMKDKKIYDAKRNLQKKVGGRGTHFCPSCQK